MAGPIPGAARRARALSPLRQASVTLVGLMMIMADGYDLQSIGFIAPEIAADWGLELSAFAPVFSAGLFGTIPGAMSAGPLARLFGDRGVLALSLVVFGLGSLGCAFAEDVGQLAALRFVVGLGVGLAVPATMTLVAANTSEKLRATLVTLVLCGQPLGAILGAALCAKLIPMYGWNSGFFLGALAPLLLAPLVWTLPPAPRPEPKEKPRAGAEEGHDGRIRALFAPSLVATSVLLWTAAFLNVFLLYVIVNWLPGLMRLEGHSREASLLAISLFNAGGIAGALSVAALIDRFGVFRIVPPAFFTAAIFIATLDVASGHLPLFLSAVLLSGVAGYGGGACIGAMAVILYPAHLRTTGAGWTLGVGRFGAALGPLGVGALLDGGVAPGVLFYVAALAASLAGASILVLSRLRR